MNTNINYHLYIDGNQTGPYSIDQLKAMWSSGAVTANAQIWTEGQTDWKPISEFSALFASSPPPVPATIEVEKTQNEAKNKKPRIGCLTILGFLVVFGIIANVSRCGGPSVSVANGIGTMQHTIFSTFPTRLAGWEIAQEVYSAATNHRELTQIVVHCDMSVAGGAVDKYGKTIDGPLTMGTITIDDLEEVRRYKDESAYASQAQDWYAGKISNMDYSYFLSK